MAPQVKYFEIKDLSDIVANSEGEKIILCDHLTSLDVLNLCFEHSAKHVVQKSNIALDKEMDLSSKTMISPDMFFQFPLSVILGDESPSSETEKNRTHFSHNLSKPSDRDDVMQNLEQFLSEKCKRQSLVGDICLAADELISNSLFNAPYTTTENSNTNVERDFSQITIDPNKKPYFYVSFTPDRIILGCTDYYGRLDVVKLIERIKLCYLNNPGDMINFRRGGAGIGSYLIFDSCASYYVAVDPGKITTICCTFPTNMSAKQRNETPKNVHIILNAPEA